MKINNKAELTTQQIVTLIILIASFAIILFLLFRLDLGKTNDKQICHNSVILNEKSSFAGHLDCKTNYVCISGGEDCENFNPTTTKKIDLNSKEIQKKEIQNQIFKSIAEEMVDCWWMFGEGKVKYVKELSGMHCAICSIIKFDKSLQETKGIQELITYDEFYKFLNSKKDKTQTYLKYLYNVNSIDSLEKKLSGEIPLNDKYSIVTGMNKNFIGKDGLIYPHFVKSSEVEKIGCEVFDITKA